MNRHVADLSTLSESVQKRINGDRELNALKRLKDIQIDESTKLEIQQAIDQRIAELASENREG
jgi:hypothetical protein